MLCSYFFFFLIYYINYNVLFFSLDPPFEEAKKIDKWYKPLIKGKIEKFWKAHHKSPIARDSDAKGIILYICYIY